MKRKSASIILTSLLIGCFPIAVSAAEAPVLEVESHLLGSAYTNGKSTLKYHLNTGVSYGEDSQCIFTLSLPDGSSVDDSKIDCSSASVSLTNGDGYYPEEYTFQAVELNGEWKNGQFIYRLDQGDLELNLDLYPLEDKDSGREWSCLGGDGHGNYHFNLTVSGIVYDGAEVESQSFPVDISIFGYNYTSDAQKLYGEEGSPTIQPVFSSLKEKTNTSPEVKDEPVWTWVGDGEKPILCDALADDFYISWPENIDASSLTNSDVTITLSNNNGETLALSADKDFYIQSEGSETQIALTFQNWAFTPVYTSMTIDVDGTAKASETYDIGSVYVYEAQQGGGGQTVDGTVTAYSFYGFANLESWEQILGTPAYLLKTEKDGAEYYYAEDADSNGYLTQAPEEALTFDAVEERNPQLIGNTVYITTRTDLKEIEKTVDGENIVFTQAYPGWDFPLPLGSLLSPNACDESLEAAPGYVIPWGTENWITNEKWAWQKGIEEGWTGIEVTPYEGKYEWKVAKGASQQFSAETDSLTWEIIGDIDEGTSVTQEGLLTVAEDESHPSFAVTVTDPDGNLGTVTIKVTNPE
ncbi:MAG: hypothetical protein Q4D16_12445 [Eubacteriales bacterium]|nr:hypothetical protein [Eubacteriales bacterium]